MSITEPLVGKFVNLRCVELSDAKFTLEIRNNPELTDFIPKVDGTIETQEQWIAKQRLKNDDYFFVIENKNGKAIGTIGCYDIDTENACCENGRYISVGDAVSNIEALVLLYDFVFDEKKLKYVNINVDERNGKIISLNKKIGAVFCEKVDMKGWISLKGRITKESYFNKRVDIVQMLNFVD